MPTKTVKPKPGLFPEGAAVRAYPKRTTEVQRREKGVPAVTAVDSGVIANGAVDITADAGEYVLFGVVNEKQSVKVDATGGKFKLKYSGQTTADIAYNATAAVLREALEALSNIAVGEVAVTGGPGSSGGTTPYIVTFLEALSGTDVAALEFVAGSEALSGGGAAVTITTLTGGSPGTAGETVSCLFTVDA